MPPDKFTYKPTADQITFGHLVAHMVVANYLLCGKAADVAVLHALTTSFTPRLCK